MYEQPITELSVQLQRRLYSSRELTQWFLERIQRMNPTLNSFISVIADQALVAADAADRRLAAGETTPLLGIPIAHKDIFCTKGIRTSCGSRMLDNFIAPYDATIVDRLTQAGAVMLGKTNMDEFAMGSSNETSWYGSVRNPWHLDRVPGGSSGGSAAAVAARLCVAATGSDTGGSIRQPAALCGVTGIKPTYGRCSRWGMIAFASSLDQAGVLARSAADAAVVLQAMAGFDHHDSTSAQESVPDYTAHLNDSLAGLRIGLPREFFDADGLAPEIETSVRDALRIYEAHGATLHEITLPSSRLAVPAYYVVAPAECSSNLARYDGVRFGYRCDQPHDLQDLYQRSRAEGFGSEVKRRIMVGSYVLSAGYYDAYYLKAQKIRRVIRDEFAQAFKTVDIIAGPTTPSVAFELGSKLDDPVAMYLNDIYTISANLAGLPALSVPIAPVSGLPVGLQLIGHYFQEARLLNVGHQLQCLTDWHKACPEIAEN
jgi:aspartyl-tRNA(Asn)/glutamyl-tRNA(Gln) amidotransferase subunit A